MRIGIVGGTFDPFHRGHLEPVLAARNLMEWRSIIYVPASRQPFKAASDVTSGYHRFAMAVLATEEHVDLHVSPRELERSDVSYTVDTLEELRSEHPDATLDWIIGDDNLERLGEWRNVDRIFELANFVVLMRTTDTLPFELRPRLVRPRERASHGNIAFAENGTVSISSTEIRRRVRAGESIDDLVDPRVSRYIQQNGLYREVQA